MRQKDMDSSSAGMEPESDRTGRAQQHLYESITDPSSRQTGHPTLKKQKWLKKIPLKEKEKLVADTDSGLIPGETGRLTVGRKISLTLT
jgi:hypothetical protein